MGKQVVTVCDLCGEQREVWKRRVGDATRLYMVEVCAGCVAPIDALIEVAVSRLPAAPATVRVSTPTDIRRAKRARKAGA